jgi:hypothetical protein
MKRLEEPGGEKVEVSGLAVREAQRDRRKGGNDWASGPVLATDAAVRAAKSQGGD